MLSKNKYVHMSACMLALLLCVLATRPFVPMGVNDDWSYIWTARVLADTGHLVYNGWGAMLLGWQAYLGALFIKLFGFSFTVVRSSILVVSLLCTALMQRIFARLGASEWTASLATLTLVLSYLFLPLSFSFMSDIPGLFVLVVCIYCCLRALQSASDQAAIAWLVCAALSNVVGGTVRQTAWLGALVIVPSAAWCMRRRRRILAVGAALWIFSALSVALCLHWFYAQPYAIKEKTFYRYHTVSAFYVSNTLIEGVVFLLPVMSAFLVTHPPGRRRLRNIAVILGAIAGSILFWWAVASKSYFANIPLGGAGNYVTTEGPIIGKAPVVIPTIARFLLTVTTCSALAGFALALSSRRNASPFADTRTTSARLQYPYLSNESLITLLTPFTLVYTFLVVTRDPVYDRYLLPLLFLAILGLIRFYSQTISDRLPWLCLVIGFAYAAYGVAINHDLFVLERARVNAANEIIAAGIPRTAVEAGFEYDGWTQLEQTGYVNDPRIVYPSDAYHPWIRPNFPHLCIGWFSRFAPSIHPQLHLSYEPDNCFRPSQFPPVVYQTWLPPRQRTLYILDSR